MFEWEVKHQPQHSDHPMPVRTVYPTKDDAIKAVLNMVMFEDANNPLVFLQITRLNK